MLRSEVVVRETPEYRLSLEPFRGWHFVHNDVYVWKPYVAREIRAVLDHWETTYGYKLRVFVSPDNEKLIRYSAIFGFTYSHKMLRPLDGEEFIILERT